MCLLDGDDREGRKAGCRSVIFFFGLELQPHGNAAKPPRHEFARGTFSTQARGLRMVYCPGGITNERRRNHMLFGAFGAFGNVGQEHGGRCKATPARFSSRRLGSRLSGEQSRGRPEGLAQRRAQEVGIAAINDQAVDVATSSTRPQIRASGWRCNWSGFARHVQPGRQPPDPR